ncbi:LemA family protein [Candidatus Woesearchaeota archaeon]|nr:LemA family protein [Candidatus Woesearchaeota archaeon]
MNYIGYSIIGVVVLGLAIYLFKTYNNFVKLRIDTERQASHIQAHLKKKFDLIPALTDVVKGYSNHEKGLLTEVTRLRSQWGSAGNINEKMKTSNMLESALSKLLIVHERYPQIKADRSFNNIQRNIWHVERELLHERKIYNKRVSWYNQKIQQFPSNIIAKMFKFEEKQFYAIENE